MALNQNQFAITPIQGMMDLEGFGSNVISCQVDHAQSTSLVPGQPVKLATTAGGIPKVVALSANSDQPFGFVAYNVKDASYAADDRVEIALFGSVMYMTSGGAIVRGASVETVYTTNKVITTGGVNPVSGFAFDTATATDQLIRVYIQSPFAQVNAALSGGAKVLNVSATLAEINAGKILIPASVGQSITVTNYTARVTGAFAGGTNIILQSSNGTPVVVSTIAEAGLTNGAILTPGSANTTLGAGYSQPLGSGDSLRVVSTGTQTTATKIDFTFTYLQA